MYFVYSILMGLAALFTAPYWLIQGMRHGKYFSNLGDRLGFVITATDRLPTDRPGAIWIHAVSVGEALSGVALAKRLKEAYPKRPLVVSTTTHNRPRARERTYAIRRRRDLFPIRLGVQRSKGSQRREARAHHHSRN